MLGGTSKQRRKYGPKHKQNTIKNDKIKQLTTIRDLINRKKFTLVEYSIENYRKKYGTDDSLLHEIAKYKAACGEKDVAKKIYQKLIDSESDNMYFCLYELARLEQKDANFELSLSYYEKILSSNHKDKCYAMVEAAKCLNFLGEYQQAEDYLHWVIDNNFSNKCHAYEILVTTMLETNNLKQAEEYLEFVKEQSDPVNYKYLKGCLEIKRNNYMGAKAYFKDILENEQHFKTKSTLALANVEYSLENYEDSIELLNRITFDKERYYYEAIKKRVACYTKMKMFDEAEEELQLLDTPDDKFRSEKNFLYGKLYQMKKDYEMANECFRKVSKTKKNLYLDSLYCSVCMLIKLEKYEEAYTLIKKIEGSDRHHRYHDRMNTFKILINKKLGLNLNIKPKHYIDCLIDDYDKSLAISHIMEHKYEDDSNERHSIFNKNINVESLYNYCCDRLTEENLYYSDFTDVYILPYPGVGVDLNNNQVDYLKIVVLPNSKDIVTLFPYDRTIKEEKTKIKKMSRIDKFNRKYNIS